MSFPTFVLILTPAVIAVGLLWAAVWLLRTEARRPKLSAQTAMGQTTNVARTKRRDNSVTTRDSVGVAGDGPVQAGQENTEIVEAPILDSMIGDSAADTDPDSLDTEAIGIAEDETVVIADVDAVNREERNV